MTNPPRIDVESARRLTLAAEPYLSCEECFDRMDTFVEDLLAARAEASDAAMRAHLAGCGACAEELESLLDLVAEERGVDAGTARRRLHGSDR